MANRNVLIKPASGSCNMRCKYCFYMDEAENREVENYGFMDEEVLEQVIQKSIEASDTECIIGYQGGEPTLRGLDFFKKSIEFQKKYNKKNMKIQNTIQTNGYNLSDEWIDFLKENHFLVGISLDGIAYTHDFNRVDASGKGTYKKVLENIQRLENVGIDYNILTVVNAQTAKKISTIYKSYKNLGFTYMQFIPCLNPFHEEQTHYDFTLTPKLYSQFLRTLFDLWYQDLLTGKMIHIPQLESYVRMIQGKMPSVCGMSGVCGVQDVVEADGEVYPCDFYVLDKYKLGNLTEVTFKEIDKRRMDIQFIVQSLHVTKECKTCKYQSICRNGCRRSRKMDSTGIYQKNIFCEAYQEVFEYIGERLQFVAENFC